MQANKIDRIRGVIMFVVAWLIGLYVYQVVQEAFHGAVGLLAAAVTVAVNLYARRRATRCDPNTGAFKFWMYLPVFLFLLVPVLVKLIIFLARDTGETWWDHLVSLLPFIFELGVPVAALLWAYWALGRMVPRQEEKNRESPQGDHHTRRTGAAERE